MPARSERATRSFDGKNRDGHIIPGIVTDRPARRRPARAEQCVTSRVGAAARAGEAAGAPAGARGDADGAAGAAELVPANQSTRCR